MMHNNEELSLQILNAFDEVKKPSIKEIAPHNCGECRDIRDKLFPYSFESVPDKNLKYLCSCFPLLGAKGLHYYLPSFLLHVLKNPNFKGLDYLLMELSPSNEDLIDPQRKERYILFSELQKKAILKFLANVELKDTQNFFEDDIKRAREIWSS